MSDVPVTAAWLAAVLLARRPSLTGPALAGLAASRGHDPPESRTTGVFVVLACALRDGSRGRTVRHMVVCAACMPGLIVLGYIQNARYGSPLGSGTGRSTTSSGSPTSDPISPDIRAG